MSILGWQTYHVRNLARPVRGGIIVAMKRYCQNCNEELVGTVNRCWRCGQEVDVSLLSELPPIRRAPVDLSQRVRMTPAADPIVSDALSPVDSEHVATGNVWKDIYLPLLQGTSLTERQRHHCAVASVTCGSLSCLLGFFTGWSIFMSLIAILLGLMGMRARRRDLATLGVILAVIGMFLGFFQIGSGLWAKYESRRLIQEWQGLQ